MFKNLSKREKNMFWMALAVLLIGFYYFQMLQPVLVEKAAMQEETDSLRSQYQAMLKTIQKRLPDVKQKLANVQALYARKADGFPQEAEVSTLLFEIEQMATARGVKLERFSPKAMSEQGDFYTLPVQASFCANYAQLTSFIYALEHSPKRMNVVTLEIKTFTDGTWTGLQADITVSIYIAKGQT